MTIRTAVIDDAWDIAFIHVETWRIAYRGIMPDRYLSSLSVEECYRRCKNKLTSSTDGTIVALDGDGKVIGWASFGPSRDEDGKGRGELYAINLDSLHWRKGYGRKLIAYCEECMVSSGFEVINLWVLEKNTRAICFYRKMGFAPDGKKRLFKLNSAELIELRYGKIPKIVKT